MSNPKGKKRAAPNGPSRHYEVAIQLTFEKLI